MSAAKAVASESLQRIIAASPPREPAKPTGHMRERIAAAIYGSRPGFMKWEPCDAYPRFLWLKDDMREMHETWADDFLRCCDLLNLQIIDTTDEKASALSRAQHEDRK